jgi:hypothetical protein
MDRQHPAKESLKRMLQRLKKGILIVLFLLVPFAGAFHPKIRKREDRDEKEIGGGK